MSKIQNDTKPPYEQFEPCKYEGECKYKNVISGRCSFETCIYNDEWPIHSDEQEYECMVCHSINVRGPRDMKIHICDSCLERIRRTEELPFSCVFCGKKQSSPSKIPLSGICDKCFGAIKNAINCKRCGN